MLMFFFLLLPLLFSSTLALANPGFSEQYERDYNIFNPSNKWGHSSFPDLTDHIASIFSMGVG